MKGGHPGSGGSFICIGTGMGPTRHRAIGRDHQDLGRVSGRDHQGIGMAGGSTKAPNLQTGPLKASTVHSETTVVAFCSDEEAWSMKLRRDSIIGLGAAARPAYGECNYSKFYIANVSNIF